MYAVWIFLHSTSVVMNQSGETPPDLNLNLYPNLCMWISHERRTTPKLYTTHMRGWAVILVSPVGVAKWYTVPCLLRVTWTVVSSSPEPPPMLTDTSTGMWIKKARLPCWPLYSQQVSHQRWIWGLHKWESMEKGSTLALKPRVDVTRSTKQGYQWNPGQRSPEVQNRGISEAQGQTSTEVQNRGISETQGRHHQKSKKGLSVKLRADITTSPKQGYQWSHEKDLCSPKFKRKVHSLCCSYLFWLKLTELKRAICLLQVFPNLNYTQ